MKAGLSFLVFSVILALPSAVARAENIEILFDGTGAAVWDVARDAERLRREFSVSEVKAATNPPVLEWRFISRGVAFNDLFLRRRIARDFTSIRVRIRNEGAAVTLGAKVLEASGAEWTTRRIPLTAGGEWQWVEFARPEWHAASWSRDGDGRMDFPLEYVTLIAFDVQPGAEYRIGVSRVDVVRPDPPVLTVEEYALPTTLRAGQVAQLALKFMLDQAAATDDTQLVFRQSSNDVFRVPIALPAPPSRLLPKQRVALRQLEFRVPLYARGGRFSVVPEIGGAVLPEGFEPVTVTIQPRQAGRTVAEVKACRGTPTLFINGEAQNGMTWATYGPTTEVFRDFTEAGVMLYTFSGTPTEAGYGLSKTVWTAPEEFDYSEFDQRVLMLLGVNPDAYFFPRLYLHAPKWWSERHPDDVVLTDPGDGKPRPFIHSGGKPAPSWASEAWRRDTVAALIRMIAHIEASPYADRVIGYHLASGTTEEWMMWGANENEWVDYSPANLARFRQWLREMYGSVALLRRAWGQEQVTFDDAAIPTKAQRQWTALGSLRDPAREQATIDFYRYNSDLVAETINCFAKAVKEATRREKVVGVFYGYLLQLCGEQRQQNAGHLALGRLLASADVDFLTSPTSYAFRQLGGEGTAHFMSLFDSVKLHGKLWFNENDVRTSVSGGQVGEWGRPADLEGDLIQQDKVLFFPTSFAPTAQDRRAVDGLKRDGRVLVFFGTPGLYREGQLDETAMRDFTGINLRLANEPTSLRVTLRDGHAITAGLVGSAYGVEQNTAPACYANDPEATVLGTLPGGRAGLVVKPHDGWTAIYSGAPLMPAPLLRRIAQLGKVHFYTAPGDVVWAAQDLVGVSVHRPGPRVITLPRTASVTDLYRATRFGDNLRSFQAEFDEHATRVFVLK